MKPWCLLLFCIAATSATYEPWEVDFIREKIGSTTSSAERLGIYFGKLLGSSWGNKFAKTFSESIMPRVDRTIAVNFLPGPDGTGRQYTFDIHVFPSNIAERITQRLIQTPGIVG